MFVFRVGLSLNLGMIVGFLIVDRFYFVVIICVIKNLFDMICLVFGFYLIFDYDMFVVEGGLVI